MKDRLKAMFARWHTIEEINSLTDRDLDDLGFSRAEMVEFSLLPDDTAKRVSAMAAIFGLTEEELRAEHAAYSDLLRTCGHCKERAKCSHVLAHKEEQHPANCGFCPNHAEYASRA